MAEGIRLRPQPGRHVPDNAMIVLTDKARPIPNVQAAPWPGCSICGFGESPFHQPVGHQGFKAYHLQLRAGTVTVSTGVWAELQKMPDLGGFEYVNPVPEPPTQLVRPGYEVQLLEKYVPPLESYLKETNGNGHHRSS